MKEIDVDFFYDPTKVDEVGFSVRSKDGEPLSAQDILDAVADCLLQHYNDYSMSPEPKYDA